MKKIIVLGMHRSGTSCVSQMLHVAGVDLGGDLTGGNVGNLEGHFESAEAMRINDSILAQSNGSWDAPPTTLSCDDATRESIQRYVERMNGFPVSGFKDPRMVITYPIWKPLLGEHGILACLRNPDSVARSLETREGWPLERGYQLWFEYNSRLAEYVRGNNSVIWFDYDRTAEQQRDWLRHAFDVLQISPNDQAFSVFDRFQKHHTRQAETNPVCEELYLKLKDAASQSWNAAEKLDHASNDRQEINSSAYEALVKLHTHHNSILQRFDTHLRGLGGSCQRQENAIHELFTKNANLELEVAQAGMRLAAFEARYGENPRLLGSLYENSEQSKEQLTQQLQSMERQSHVIERQSQLMEKQSQAIERQSRVIENCVNRLEDCSTRIGDLERSIEPLSRHLVAIGEGLMAIEQRVEALEDIHRTRKGKLVRKLRNSFRKRFTKIQQAWHNLTQVSSQLRF